ncbi:MAG TPA: hypothetical protein VKO63_04340, partial [Chitinispirillaceae bacterium]|nr:hypothetical protein [Chitinispirillaceae bacterium]
IELFPQLCIKDNLLLGKSQLFNAHSDCIFIINDYFKFIWLRSLSLYIEILVNSCGQTYFTELTFFLWH